jgi:molybdate transport system substrate-binding protein
MPERRFDRCRFIRLACAALALALAVGRPASASAEEPLVAAAAVLRFALADIAAAFEADTGGSVRLSFGSSGNFARQIRQAAPFQVYLSADEQYVLALARDGFTRDEGTLYAEGRIVLIVPHGSPLKADGSLDDLKAALLDGRVTHFAIANPDHAPYGKRAEEALRHKGIWDKISPNLVRGENVGQAAQFATSANAQGGIIAYSLALAPAVSELGSYALIPERWHAPLRQRMVLLKNAGAAAERFYDYLRRPPARAIFREYGFVLPGEAG